MENSNTRDLGDALKRYTERMRNIRALSAPGLEGLKTAEAYSYVLKKNFENIGTLAGKNREFIQDILNPILESAEPLDEETIRILQDTNEELLDATEGESIDLPIASLLSERISRDAENKDDLDYRIRALDKEIEINYLIVNMTKRVYFFGQIANSFREKGLKALEGILQYLDKDQFLRLSEESRETVLVDSRYGSSLYENMDPSEKDLIFTMIHDLERALQIAEDPFYHEAVPGFDWKYHLFRIYDYFAQMNARHLGMKDRVKIADYTDRYLKLWKTDPDLFTAYTELIEIEGYVLRNSYLAGRVSKEEYREKTYEMFLNRRQNSYEVADYAVSIGFPADYISFLEEDELNPEELKRVDGFYRNALSYIFNVPKMGLLSVTLEVYARMIYEFREFPGCITFEEMGIRSLAALHPPTYIHSQMVSRISACLAKQLLEMEPELFTDVKQYLEENEWHSPEAEPEQDWKNRICEYTRHAALCHDFGKIMIIDTILVYGRKLLDFEFRLIQSHPEIGGCLLAKHASTQTYSEVAIGHHLWYNGKRGYPSGFRPEESPVKTIIDIVAVADCMDAATDTVGRSYNKGKTLDDYIREVEEGAGERYAPWAPRLLKEPALNEELRYILENERMRIYRETYGLLRHVDSVDE